MWVYTTHDSVCSIFWQQRELCLFETVALPGGLATMWISFLPTRTISWPRLPCARRMTYPLLYTIAGLFLDANFIALFVFRDVVVSSFYICWNEDMVWECFPLGRPTPVSNIYFGLVFPLAAKWDRDRTFNKSPAHLRKLYRNELDVLEEIKIRWSPYDDDP